VGLLYHCQLSHCGVATSLSAFSWWGAVLTHSKLSHNEADISLYVPMAGPLIVWDAVL
jgi:hypothetical protein